MREGIRAGRCRRKGRRSLRKPPHRFQADGSQEVTEAGSGREDSWIYVSSESSKDPETRNGAL